MEPTAGEWKWHWITDSSGNHAGYRIYTSNDKGLVTIARCNAFDDESQLEANGRLICAAKSLLKALLASRIPIANSAIRGNADAQDLLSTIDAALAKASSP